MQENVRARAQLATGASIFLVFFTLLSALPLCSYWVSGLPLGTFSARHCIAPLAGMYLGGILTLLLYAIKTLYALCAGGFIHMLTLANYLPSLGAAAYLAAITPQRKNTGMHVGAALIPLVCLAFFLVHPIGTQAPAYTLVWLIPILTAWFAKAPFFIQALAGTCTAHAIGSTLWLYAGLIPDAIMLHQLIPCVIIERLFFALGITSLHLFISWASNRLVRPWLHYMPQNVTNHRTKKLFGREKWREK